MQTIEYRDVQDKSKWKRGPWDSEPDKVQWLDETTGLPCLIVRGPVGALCGYVGVDGGHFYYGKSCDDVDASVHGGLTFAHSCAQHSEQDFAKFCASREKLEQQAQLYPIGDAARSLAKWKSAYGNYAEYVRLCEESSICHRPEPGEPDCIWWFGFDCAHAGDVVPGMSEFGLTTMSGKWGETYKDFDWVKAEVESLAKQLRAAA